MIENGITTAIVDEVKYYVQEMMLMDRETELEAKVYTDLLWFGRCNSKELSKVIERMNS